MLRFVLVTAIMRVAQIFSGLLVSIVAYNNVLLCQNRFFDLFVGRNAVVEVQMKTDMVMAC